jgi:hypothetical protein
MPHVRAAQVQHIRGRSLELKAAGNTGARELWGRGSWRCECSMLYAPGNPDGTFVRNFTSLGRNPGVAPAATDQRFRKCDDYFLMLPSLSN